MRKFGDKLLTQPAKSNVKALRDKVRLCVQSALGLSQEALLRKLNPLIRGWANYYRNGAAKRTFERLDHHVYWQLWRWAKRRHPAKNAAWKMRKYFSATGKSGVFSVRLIQGKSRGRVLTLYRAASTTIKRHIKVRGAANPYDLRYSDYFEKRRSSAERRSYGKGTAQTTRSTQTRTVNHWLADVATCP